MVNRTNDLTPKQTRFCQAMVSGCTMSDAYREAYSAEKMKPASIHREASVLMSNPMVTQRVERLQHQKDRAVVASSLSDRERVLTKLRDMMESSKTESAQLRAAELLGKSVGLFKDVQVVETDERTPEEIAAYIRQRIAELEAKRDAELEAELSTDTY